MRRVLFLPLFFAIANAAVTQVEVTNHSDLPIAGAEGQYERISGKLHFAVDPKLKANAMITDLALAPRNAQGLVEFASDFLVMRPKDTARSNGTALLEIVNRGRPLMWAGMQVGAGGNMVKPEDFGDAFLLKQGFTLVWVGWQWDANSGPASFKLYAPVVQNITGPVRVEVLTDQKSTSANLPYPVSDARTATLTVRNEPYAVRTAIPRSDWQFNDAETRVEYSYGFEPGRIYEFIYTGKDPVVSGLGMAAVRDYISYIKQNGVAPGIGPNEVKRAMAYGFSQSGRLLRNFLYDGFNADEQGNQVFEAVWAHGAGGGRGSFNQRFAQPGMTSGQFTGSYYPTDQAPYQPAELLAKSRAANVTPKLILTNGSHEYWGRAAALNHINADGTADVTPPDDTRIYYISGTQHNGGGPNRGNLDRRVQNMTNGMEWTYFMRATMVAMNRWITNNLEPAPSRIPRIDQRELVPLASLKFPNLPNVRVPVKIYAPRALDYGPEFASKRIVALEPPVAGAAMPALIPQVDIDGNETSGVRLPELQVPLATYMGWNLRSEEVGSPDQLYSLIGSMVPFPRTRTARQDTSDPRMSIAERYRSSQDYLGRIEIAAQSLAAEGFLLDADIPQVVERARQHWIDYAATPASESVSDAASAQPAAAAAGR